MTSDTFEIVRARPEDAAESRAKFLRLGFTEQSDGTWRKLYYEPAEKTAAEHILTQSLT